MRGTVKGELAYPQDPWMKANETGFRTFKLCEQYDQQPMLRSPVHSYWSN